MSFKKPITEQSIHELHQKLRRLIYYFEQGEPLTDERLDMYLMLKKRIARHDSKYELNEHKTFEIDVDGEKVIGEITVLERFHIEIELLYPYVNWRNQSHISGPGRSTPNHFLKSYKRVSERLLRNSFKKIKMIDEKLADIIKVHDDLQDELKAISCIENDRVKERIIDKLNEWFFHDFIFVSSVTGLIASVSDRPQIEHILKEFKASRKKLYLI